MDVEAERKKLEDQKAFIEAFLDHPLAREILLDNKEEQEVSIERICNVPIDSFESFFGHFQAIGYLRGLRRSRNITTESLDRVKEELNQLEN